jgi:TonB family protein
MSIRSIERASARRRVRPVNSPPASRWLAEIVVCYRGSIVEVAHLGPSSAAYTVGEGPEASFKLDGAQLPSQAATVLVERVGAGFVLRVPPGFAGRLEDRGQRLSLTELIELRPGLAATLTRGELRFDVALVEGERIEAGRAPLDRPFWASLIGNATVVDAMAVALEDEAAEARFASYFEQADEPVEQETVEPERVEARSSGGGAAGARAKGREGKRGEPGSRGRGASPAKRVPSIAGAGLSRLSNPAGAATNAGILGILAAQDRTFLASASSAFGSSEADALLWASTTGLAGDGVGGLGLTSDGRGGGGTASEVAGLGAVGILGQGTGSTGLSYRSGPQHGERRARVPVASAREPTTTDNIDRDVIRRIVRSHLNEVRSCYNAGLTRNPGLAGRVTVRFSILSTGKVASSVIEQNTAKDARLGDCIAAAVKRWKFPAIRGGGTAVVSYPFQLRTR